MDEYKRFFERSFWELMPAVLFWFLWYKTLQRIEVAVVWEFALAFVLAYCFKAYCDLRTLRRAARRRRFIGTANG